MSSVTFLFKSSEHNTTAIITSNSNYDNSNYYYGVLGTISRALSYNIQSPDVSIRSLREVLLPQLPTEDFKPQRSEGTELGRGRAAAGTSQLGSSMFFLILSYLSKLKSHM